MENRQNRIQKKSSIQRMEDFDNLTILKIRLQQAPWVQQPLFRY